MQTVFKHIIIKLGLRVTLAHISNRRVAHIAAVSVMVIYNIKQTVSHFTSMHTALLWTTACNMAAIIECTQFTHIYRKTDTSCKKQTYI